MSLERRENRLALESSPYLRQHAGNPVDWFPWGEEALEKARQEDKPIFLSIGYAACHWCHVMERESFESAEVAAFLNRHFVSIKVDREERPDVDAVYMEAVVAMTGSGGWPLTVFLTPTLKPFFGGTYFPPQRRWGRPSFLELLVAVVEAWSTRRADIEKQAGALLDHLSSAGKRNHSGALDAHAALSAAVAALTRRFDPAHGGFDGAPKFPSPARLFLLCRAATGGDNSAARMLATTLDGMARGGMYDWVGGGFHRYSVDAQWLVPHFEKMLYDNALLARLYGEAGLALSRAAWLEVARETAEYLVREMQGAEGGFFSSTDADSEGEEGKFFTWSQEDIAATLGEEEAAAIIAACGVTPHGNFEHGRTILRPASDLVAVARSLGLPPEGLGDLLQKARVNLRGARARRVPPALDDKRLAGWNGMAVWALAYLGVTFDEPRFLSAATRAGEFLLAHCLREDRPVVRSWKDGVASGAETLEDVAWVAAGLAELYQASGETRYLAAARQVLRARLPHYRNANGVLFDTPDDGEPLPLRPRSPHDGATPSSAAVAVRACLTVAALADDGELRRWAEEAVAAEGAFIAGAADQAAGLLLAALAASSPPSQVVIVGDPAHHGTRELLRATLASPFRPTAVAWAAPPVPSEVTRLVPLFAGRAGTAGHPPLAYLCHDGRCDLPFTSAAELAAALVRCR